MRISLKKTLVGIMIMALSVAFLSGCNGAGSSNAVAVINGNRISKEEFDKRYKILEYNYVKANGEDSLKQTSDGKSNKDLMKEKLLDYMIQNVVINEYLKGKNFTPPKADVDASLKKFKDSINSDKELKAFIEINKIDDVYLIKTIEEQLYYKELTKKVTEEAKLDPKKLTELYKTYIVKVKASHILLDKETDANMVLEKLKKGEKFDALAKQYSKDTKSGLQGGSLGYFERGAMVPEFEKAAFETKKGKISGIVKTQYGFHIIKVLDRKTINDLEKENANKDEITKYKQSISNDLINEAITSKINALIKKAKVTKNIKLALK